jgi:hypothetical protein
MEGDLAPADRAITWGEGPWAEDDEFEELDTDIETFDAMMRAGEPAELVAPPARVTVGAGDRAIGGQ